VASLDVHSRGGADISIGQNTFAIGRVRLYAHETALIRIGDGCLIGDDVLCMASDMHSIIDVDNDKRINPPDDIVVGDRVWIGAGAILLKGTTIGDGSVVGIRSVAMGEFPENCMLLGYPARLVRSGITWAEELRPL
jgi:acetyltransferase-like isoleucine patch superfamily enzyme